MIESIIAIAMGVSLAGCVRAIDDSSSYIGKYSLKKPIITKSGEVRYTELIEERTELNSLVGKHYAKNTDTPEYIP